MFGMMLVLLFLFSSGQLKGSGADQPIGYYVKSPLFNFFMAPNRTIRQTDASYIMKQNANRCTCRNACFAVIGCQSWSLTKLNDIYTECRVSKEGPDTANLEEDSNSTYFFLENNRCSLSITSNQTKTFTYPREMLEDVALRKQVYGSLAHNSDYSLSNVNDGNDTTTYASQVITVTKFWAVDLGSRKTLFHLDIFPRQISSLTQRFRDIEVRAGDEMKTSNFSTLTLLATYKGPYTLEQNRLLLSCNGFTGRYLYLVSTNPNETNFDFNTLQAFAVKEI